MKRVRPLKRLMDCVKDVLAFDSRFGITEENTPTLENLIYNALALAGELGEVAEVLAQVLFDEDTDDDGQLISRTLNLQLAYKSKLAEEIVDAMIYICKLVIVGQIDLGNLFVYLDAPIRDHERIDEGATLVKIMASGGQIANVAKKIWRDGDSKELRSKLVRHIGEVVGILPLLFASVSINFENAWNDKFVLLIERWNNKPQHKRVVKIQIEKRDD